MCGDFFMLMRVEQQCKIRKKWPSQVNVLENVGQGTSWDSGQNHNQTGKAMTFTSDKSIASAGSVRRP